MENNIERLEKIKVFVKDTLMKAEARNYKDVSPALVNYLAEYIAPAVRITRNGILAKYNALVMEGKILIHVETETLKILA